MIFSIPVKVSKIFVKVCVEVWLQIGIYHFLILYISFANLKNFSFLRLHLHSRHPQFSYFLHYVTQSKNLDN